VAVQRDMVHCFRSGKASINYLPANHPMHPGSPRFNATRPHDPAVSVEYGTYIPRTADNNATDMLQGSHNRGLKGWWTPYEITKQGMSAAYNEFPSNVTYAYNPVADTVEAKAVADATLADAIDAFMSGGEVHYRCVRLSDVLHASSCAERLALRCIACMFRV
jgi:hypothetical protein